MSHVADYLDDITQSGARLSEVHLCTRFAERILGGLLGYQPAQWIINPNADRDETSAGIPDITVSARVGEESVHWVVMEAKLDDELIRHSERRQFLWNDKRKYVTADTAYFVWLAKRTIIVCRPDGETLVELYLEDGRLMPPADTVICSTDDDEIADALGFISARAAQGLAFLESFRIGELVSRHIPVGHDTVDKLTHALTDVIASLRAYLTRRWHALAQDFAVCEKEMAELEEFIAVQRDLLPAHQADLLRNRIARRHAESRALFLEAFPEFQHQQAYTDWEPYGEHRSIREDLEEIFRTNAAYVILGRLLFVRLAEDMEDNDRRPLIPRKISNSGLRLWRQLVGAEEPHIGRLVDLAFTQASSVFQQLFTPTHFDAILSLDDEEFDRVLLLVLFRLNAFDFRGLDRDTLGDLYQKLLPRDLRKKMGEFYTDVEVVEYILHRTGFVEAARAGAPRLMDPACGSGTFLVRAAHYVILGAQERGISDDQTLAMVENCIHGLDINDFAVFLARMNLLFLVFDLVVKTRRDVDFRVYEANSLTRADVPIQFTTAHGVQQPAQIEATEGEKVRDDRYDFVVGNPPYVRAERIPDGDREVIQHAYRAISRRNVDLAAYFVYRGAAWLAEGGVFGMIVPRAIADAGFAKPLRDELDRAPITISELTPLDWACHELFDSDVVPFILQYQCTPRPPGATTRIVQRIRSKAELVEEWNRTAGPRVTEVGWEDFTQATGGELWPLEVTEADLRVGRRLSSLPSLATGPRYAVKLGSDCRAADAPFGEAAPLVTGSDVYAYFLDRPRRFAAVSEAADRSIWSSARWDPNARAFVSPDNEHALPELVAVSAVIGITLNAALMSPQIMAAQDTTLLSLWHNEDVSPHSLVGILNAELIRWYAWVFLRAGVAGGGRRDHHTYPRTIQTLPMPARPIAEWADTIAEPVDTIIQVAAQAAVLGPELWAQALASHGASATLAHWPVRWQAWPEGRALTRTACEVVRERDDCLRLSRTIALTADEPALLDFLGVHMPPVMQETQRLTRDEAQALPVPPAGLVPRVLEQYRNSIVARDRHREEYLRLVDVIDEAVFAAYELPKRLERTVRRRMTEFPLSDYAANYRKPWEPTRRPRITLFKPGERYHSGG